ncbi:MAG: NAD(P)-dependent oxidoreductase [Alphaproteobacteria bacterium]|nr:NAD(P)-dependent oxidoreductase [Alphaproteobacteria bacterium]
MNLLVTGAMGHVGYEIARQAAARGIRVVATHAGTFRAADAEALGPGVTWVAGDLSDPAAVEAIAARHAIDACIHAAAVSNEAYAKPEPLKAIAANVGGTANMLDAARRHGWRRFVLVSTGSVFQRDVDPVRPILEDHPPSPINIYGTTKRAAEMLTTMYRATFGLSAATVRISWVFGPPLITDSPTRGPIPSFLGRALRGEAIREGGADFAASFTYVADVAEGLIEAARAPALNHDIYHLGSGVNFTAGEVAAAVRKSVPGAVIELGPGTLPWTTYTSPRGPLAGERFKQDTGYTVRHSLDAAVAAYAAWMRSAPRG